MSEDKEKASNSWQRAGGYKPEWAREFDTDTPNQRSDSESFDRAVEMGVEAAEALEREKLVSSSSSSSSSRKSKKTQAKKKQNEERNAKEQQKKRSHTKKSQAEKSTFFDKKFLLITIYISAGLAIALLLSVFIASSNQRARDSEPYYWPKEFELNKYSPEEKADGSYHVRIFTENAHVHLVLIPMEKVGMYAEPLVMRVRGHIGNSTHSSCPLMLKKDQFSEDVFEAYPDWCAEADGDTFEHLVVFPKQFYSAWREHWVLEMEFSYGAQVDIDFFPISVAAVPWNTSEPLTGSESTFVAFSGSLEGLTMNFDSSRVFFSVYDSKYSFRDLAPNNIANAFENVSFEAKADLIKELGFDRDDASGYIFVEVKEKSDSGSPMWQLN